jgi:hypothetical protein
MHAAVIESRVSHDNDNAHPVTYGKLNADCAEQRNGGQSSVDGLTATSVYPILAQHQRAEEWARREIIADFQIWAERFIGEFKLDIVDIALCVDRLPRNWYGYFRPGHNGFGLKGEIAINARYLGENRPEWQVLGTLLHELLHAWQEIHGTPGKRNHHNVEFREKARGLGLNVDRRGVTGYAASSLFKDCIRRFGVEAPDDEFTPPCRPPGESKLKKWTCGCGTNVRVAIADFQAVCLKCEQKFARYDPTAHASEMPIEERSEDSDELDIQRWDWEGGAPPAETGFGIDAGEEATSR